MTRFHKPLAGLVLAATLTSSLAASAPAHASAEGRKNTAIALGAVAVHQLLNGKTTNGLLAGAATAYAYKQYKDKKEDEDRANRWKRQKYSRNYGRSYRGSNRR